MRTINVEGASTIKFNIFEFQNTTPIPIANYNQHIADVRTENKTKSLYSFYKPGNIPMLNPFKEFVSGRCYIVAAKNNFPIYTDAPENFSTPPAKLVFEGAPPAKFTIFRYPYQTPVKLSSYPSILRAEATNPSKTMFRIYSSASTINPFTTFEYNKYYIVLSNAPFEIRNPDISLLPTPTPSPAPVLVSPTRTPMPTSTATPTPTPQPAPTPTAAPIMFTNTLTGPDEENPVQRISITGNSDTIYFNVNNQEPSTFVNMIVSVNGEQRSSISFAKERVGQQFGYRLNNSGSYQTTGVFEDGQVNLTI